MIKILQDNIDEENRILRNKCESIKKEEFGTEELKSLIDKMKKAASQDPDGVALAAPQIGINRRIFVIDEKRGFKEDAKWKPTVFINPEIINTSSKMLLMHEGCLSVRGTYGDTWRATNVTVTAYDENGNKFNYGAGGLTAHIIQHECDHLDGILFVDHGVNLMFDEDWRKHWEKK